VPLPDYDQLMSGQPAPEYRGIEAAMVVTGFVLIVVGLAILTLGGNGSSQDPVGDLRTTLLAAIVLAAIGAAVATIGVVRTALYQPVRPPITVSAALALGGVIGLALAAAIPTSWIGRYLPTDPRSQPSHIVGAVVFFGGFAAVVAVSGCVLVVGQALNKIRRSGDIADR
jgi:hypothetical protein